MKKAYSDSQTNSFSIETINGVKFTLREIDILACILGGRSAKKIASSLALSTRTVENYTRNIMLKIEGNSRQHILDFLEKSDKVSFLRKHYSTLFPQISTCEEEDFSLNEKAFLPPPSKIKPDMEGNTFSNLRKKKFFLFKVILFFIVCGGAWITLRLVNNEESLAPFQMDNSIRSDLNIPADSSLLDRPKLISQLKKKLRNQKGIQTVALIGPGGAGKTILARLYARQEKANVIWEINAETFESQRNSLESFANALSNSEEDNKILKDIKNIKDAHEKQDRVLLFIKRKLKSITAWVLIFDNVEKFSDIQHYFPSEPKLWGNGKIILTTRDAHIQQNNQIKESLSVGELNSQEKQELFIKIMNLKETQFVSAKQKIEANNFIEKLPPFPLDISVAAYYLKATRISYDAYLKNLTNIDPVFIKTQEDLLQESGNYTRTRYQIIIMSLKRLIELNKNFLDCFLFLSLIDSDKIPRELLNYYKNNTMVDSFIYNLKKYSFVTGEINHSSFGLLFSIHKSTQKVILSYLKDTLKLEKNPQMIEPIARVLEVNIEDILKKEDVCKMKQLKNHYEKFLTHSNLLSDEIIISLNSKLGYMYYNLGYYKQSRKFFEESLLNKELSKNQPLKAWILSYLGQTYRSLGYYEKAQTVLEESNRIYEQFLPGMQIELARSLVYLGNAWRDLGDYTKARNLIERGLKIHQRQFPKNQLGCAEAFAYLGIVYRSLGKPQEYKDTLEKSFTLFTKILPETHAKVTWSLSHIGFAYANLGDYKKAKNILEKCSFLYNKTDYEYNDDVIFLLSALATVYQNLGETEKAKDALEKSFIISQQYCPKFSVRFFESPISSKPKTEKFINLEKAEKTLQQVLTNYEKNYGKNHLCLARTLLSLGQVYLIENKIQNAEQTLNEALNVFQKNSHPEAYICLELLADLYVVKYRNENSEQKELLRQKAIDLLSQALEITKTYFPEDSIHNVRIQSHLHKIQKE